MRLEELNRRIAEELMGEPRPDYLPGRQPHINYPATTIFTERGNWWWDAFFGWKPVDFSGDFDQAMRAVYKLWEAFNELAPRWLIMEHFPPLEESRASVENGAGHYLATGQASAIPEAICRALLAYKDKETPVSGW